MSGHNIQGMLKKYPNVAYYAKIYINHRRCPLKVYWTFIFMSELFLSPTVCVICCSQTSVSEVNVHQIFIFSEILE
jgi:hypothetical protein